MRSKRNRNKVKVKQKKTSKHLYALILLVCLLLPFTSCGEVNIVASEQEILAAAQTLIEKSVLWNEIFYIDGMRPLQGGRSPSASYVEVDPSYLEEIGLYSVAEIKQYGAQIFSPDMMSSFEQTLFGSLRSDTGALISSAACMDYEERVTGVAMYTVVNTEESPKNYKGTPYGEHVEYLYDTMTVTYNKNYAATVEITVRGTEEKNLGLTDTVTVQLQKVGGVWYLDNLTVTKIKRES